MGKDLHATVTQTIIEAIEAGKTTKVLPWQSHQQVPTKLSDGTPYRGINVLNLWAVALLRGYDSAVWGGYHGWRAVGGQVRKGERGTIVVYSHQVLRDDTETGERVPFHFSRSFNVFNRTQIEGLPDVPCPVAKNLSAPMDLADTMDDYAAFAGVSFRVEGNRAYYTPSTDTVTMPRREYFTGTATQSRDMGYACTLAHECIHWTGHLTRLDRFTRSPNHYERAHEELVAELGAAFLCTTLGFPYTGVEDHAGYIEHWLEAMKADNSALFRASSAASQAVDWLQEKHASHRMHSCPA